MKLHILIPGVILLALVLDIGSRFAPPQWISFRAWEAAVLFPADGGPFAAKFFYDNPRSYGDAANFGNRPSYREYRREMFTTDEWGFRNTPVPKGAAIRMIVTGDSYAAGSGLCDAQTLSAQLADAGQVGVYNAGNLTGPESWPTLEAVIRRLGMKNGLVVYEQSERFEVPLPFSAMEGAREKSTADRLFPAYWDYSPVRILCGRVLAALQNDVWLPNPAVANVVVRRLQNGREFLFLTAELGNFVRDRSTDPSFFVELNRRIKSTSNELLVILIPDKYNVYYPLLQNTEKPAAEEGRFLSGLARNLKDAGVPVLDLTPVLRKRAAAALAEGKYVYFADDSHWNELGVSAVARVILDWRP